MPDGPGGPIDLREDLPYLCRANRADVRKRVRCSLCGDKISINTLMVVNRRHTVYRHACCVSRARQKINNPIRPAEPDQDWRVKMRVAVTGGRDFAQYTFLASKLDTVPMGSLAHGGALGADFLAGRWARRKNVPTRVYEAEWGLLGPRAGPVRNERMLDDFAPALLVAFAGGVGTAHCIGAAKQRKIPVWDTTSSPTLPAALCSPTPFG